MTGSRINGGNSRVAVASKVRDFFQSASNEQVADVLMANSLCFLRTALAAYSQKDTTNSNYKYCVMHLSQAFELMLKARIAETDKQLIVAKPDGTSFAKTIDFKECVEKLRTQKIVIQDNHLQAMYDLRGVRNDIQHFGLLGIKDPLDALISYCGCVYWAFLLKNLSRYRMRPTLSREQFELLWEWDQNWHFATMEACSIMAAWQLTLEPEQSQFEVRVCPECCVLSLIIDNTKGTTQCRCCGHKM
jgi:hypothetical protein